MWIKRLGVILILVLITQNSWAESGSPASQELSETSEPISQKEFKVQPEVPQVELLSNRARSLTTAEADIPVSITEAQIKKSESTPWTRMVWGVAVFIAFLVLAWLGIKRFRFANFSKKAAIPIRLVHQFHLAPKRSLAVVEVAGEYLLLGVTDHSVNLVKTLSLLDEDLNKGEASTVFEKVLDEKFPHGEEFEMGNPKDFLSLEKNQRKSGFIE